MYGSSFTLKSVQYFISRHRRQQVYRLASYLFDHIFRIAERQLEKSYQPTPRFLIEIATVPERIPDSRGLGIKPHIPGQRGVTELAQRFGQNIDRQQVREPAPDDVAKRDQAALPGCQVERHIEAIAAFPITGCGCIVKRVAFAACR